MSFRSIVVRIAGASALGANVVVMACNKPAHASPRTSGAPSSAGQARVAGGDAATPSSSGGGAASTGGDSGKSRPANHLGRIPILEYHVIGGEKNADYTRTRESFRADLEDAYARGYRPITMKQMLDRDFREVPAGMSPVVVVFDDASPEQFSYVEQNGATTIDPTSGVGIWLDFAKSHPGWGNRAVFCMLNGGSHGHNFFGDGPRWHGQHRQWRFQKVKWLADNGFELCAHTLWHAQLNKYSDAVVQEQIARNVMGIDSAVAGYKLRTFALPYGVWPKNRALAWQGVWTDPKTGVAHRYAFDAVLEVAGGPTRSPYDPQFNPHSVTRIQAVGDDIRHTLDRLDREGTRFVQ